MRGWQFKKLFSWEAGPKSIDGLWAPWWYESVHKSTGFKQAKTYPQVCSCFLWYASIQFMLWRVQTVILFEASITLSLLCTIADYYYCLISLKLDASMGGFENPSLSSVFFPCKKLVLVWKWRRHEAFSNHLTGWGKVLWLEGEGAKKSWLHLFSLQPFPFSLYDLLEQSLPLYNILRRHVKKKSSLLSPPLPPPDLPVPANEKLLAWVGDEIVPRDSAKVLNCVKPKGLLSVE